MLMITASVVFLYACMTSLFHALGQVTKFSMMMVENLARGPGRIEARSARAKHPVPPEVRP